MFSSCWLYSRLYKVLSVDPLHNSRSYTSSSLSPVLSINYLSLRSPAVFFWPSPFPLPQFDLLFDVNVFFPRNMPYPSQLKFSQHSLQASNIHCASFHPLPDFIPYLLILPVFVKCTVGYVMLFTIQCWTLLQKVLDDFDQSLTKVVKININV